MPRAQDGDLNGTATCDIGAVEVVAPILVTSTFQGTGNGCTLVEAINQANDNATGNLGNGCNPGLPNGPDTIVLNGQTVSFTTGAFTASGVNALPSITSDIVIEGGGGTIERSSASNDFRIALVSGSGGLILRDVTLRGGVANNAAGNGNNGGGILSYSPLTLDGATISGNSASGNGGGVFVSAALTASNSTISGNTASQAGGVGLAGASQFTHVTIANNSASVAAGLLTLGDPTVTLSNSLIAGNSGGANCAGTNFVTTGTNLANDNSCGGFTNNPDASALLGPLADNGGPTQTHLLRAGHPGIDTATGTSPATDQRGVTRPQDGDSSGGAQADVGAVELNPGQDPTGLIPVAAGVVDATPNNGVCSIIEAIENANDNTTGRPNADCAPGIVNGADTVVLPAASVFSFTVANNTSNGGNALPVITSPISIQGNGAVLKRIGGAPFRLLEVATGGDLLLDSVTVQGGSVATDGGGIRNNGGNLILTNSAVSGNTATGILTDGGGIYTRNGNLTLTNSSVSGNQADDDGGGIYNRSGDLTLTNTIVSSNRAANGGGGIFSDTNLTDQTTTLTNSTVSGNNAGGSGGGLFNLDGLSRIRFSTITDNRGSGVYSRGDAFTQTDVQASIIAGNANNDDVASPGITNSFVTMGDNLIGGGNATGAFNAGDQNGFTDPMLGPLADNGGATRSHQPLLGSPAVDAVNGMCDVATDQRGQTRPQDADNSGGAVCDIGAVEVVGGGHLDSDNDGIPDVYENGNDLSPTGDFDSDGVNDLAEYQNGTDATNPDSDDDGLGDAIDADALNASNACIPDGNGDAVLAAFTAPAGQVTQCAAENSIRVLNAANTMIEANSVLQLYTLSVTFDNNAAVPLGANLQVHIGDPTPGGP